MWLANARPNPAKWNFPYSPNVMTNPPKVGKNPHDVLINSSVFLKPPPETGRTVFLPQLIPEFHITQ